MSHLTMALLSTYYYYCGFGRFVFFFSATRNLHRPTFQNLQLAVIYLYWTVEKKNLVVRVAFHRPKAKQDPMVPVVRLSFGYCENHRQSINVHLLPVALWANWHLNFFVSFLFLCTLHKFGTMSRVDSVLWLQVHHGLGPPQSVVFDCEVAQVVWNLLHQYENQVPHFRKNYVHERIPVDEAYWDFFVPTLHATVGFVGLSCMVEY